MPALDTYKTIERFARNPDDGAALQAYKFLRHRTALEVKWQALQYVPAMEHGTAVDLYTGTNERVTVAKDLSEMSEPQRQDLFEQACKATGVQLDPSILRKNKQ